MDVLRTPDDCFKDLPDFSFAPNYLDVPYAEHGSLRMHYIDEGDKSAPVVLMLHGEPSWSFLYRKVISPVVDAGYRVIVPDHIGFGRSDKLRARKAYSYQQFIDWLSFFVAKLDLQNIVLLCQDWGGPIGLSVLAQMPERFKGVVISNTLLPNCEPEPNGVAVWPGELIENWASYTEKSEDLAVADIISAACKYALSEEVKAAYDAPFPDASYKAAVLEFPSLIPLRDDMPGVFENRQTWQLLEGLEIPFLTAFSDSDLSTKAWEQVFQQRLIGAQGQDHRVINNGGHFVQEDQGEALSVAVLSLMAKIRF